MPTTSGRWGRVPTAPLAAALVLLLCAGTVTAIMVGPVGLDPGQIGRVFAARLRIGAPVDPTVDFVVWELRFPRALLAGLVGGSLAVAGTALQALVGNPLADPYVLGVSSGAGLAATIVLVTGLATGGLLVQLSAFGGAVVALVLVVLLAAAGGSVASTVRLLLAGVAVGYLLSGLTSYLIFTAQQPMVAQSALFWLTGSLGGAEWRRVGVPAIALGAGVVWLLCRSAAMDALSQGDETARILGYSPALVRTELLVVASLTTGVSVAVSGGVGFVGLMVPHLIRLLRGPSHRGLLPTAMLGGAVLLVWCDIAARTVAVPSEIPLGVVTSIVGAPVFAYLLVRSRRQL